MRPGPQLGLLIQPSGVGLPRSAPSTPRFDRASTAFLATVLVSQWAFILYMLLHYTALWLTGAPEGWAETTVIGWRPGDAHGNLQFLIHILAGAALTALGTLQLLPGLRRRQPRLHRWSGRLFLLLAIPIALGGVWLTWIRGAVSSQGTAFSMTATALAIVAFAALAFRTARAKRFADHRLWALRLFVAINAVWTFRIGTVLWVLAHGGEMVGIGENFDGPFVPAWHWGSLILPLALVELHRHATRTAALRPAATALFWGFAAAVAVGSALAIWSLWLPPALRAFG